MFTTLLPNIDHLNFDSIEGGLLLFAAIFLCISLAMIFVIYITRAIKSNRKRKAKKYRGKFRKILNAIIINEVPLINDRPDPSFEFWLSKLKALLHSSFSKKILMDEIIGMKKNITGDSARALIAIYSSLGLSEISMQKLRSIRWHVQATGIRELAEMDHKPAVPKILELLDSKRSQLKEESLIALVRLKTQDPLSYLKTLNGTLSSWMQINIHYHLQSYDQTMLPDFTQLFYHPNQGVRIFGIQMVIQFRQVNAAPTLAALLLDNDSRIKAMAVKALAEIQADGYIEDIVKLAEKTWSDSRLLKQIIKAFGQLGDKSHSHMVSRFLIHPSYSVRFETLRTLKLIGCTPDHSEDYTSILRHITDPLLQ